MADLDELTHYVVVHPDDYERRWTLAKKLYMAWEYQSALNHLLVLKKSWAPKLNVLRYLAATYYRLGQYDEAIQELKYITRAWPNETAVWEQLARVYEVSGRIEDAAKTWEHVARLSPAHPVAARSVVRLRSNSADSRREDLRLRDSDSGIDLSPYRVCAKCGAQNSEEFDRCWQCHALLGHMGIVDGVGGQPVPESSKVWLRTLFGGLSTVAAITASVYLTFLQLRRMQESDVLLAFDSVYGVLAQALLVPRLGVAAVLVAVWPLSLLMTHRLLNATRLTFASAFGAGLLMAALGYLALWAPLDWLVYMPPLLLAASLAVTLILPRDSLWRAVGVWSVHIILPLSAACGVFVLLAGTAPVLEFPAILRYQTGLSSLASPGEHPIVTDTYPSTSAVRFSSTGSPWLDRQGRRVIIEIRPGEPTDAPQAEFRVGETVIGSTSEIPYQMAVNVVPDTTIYLLRVTGPEGGTFHAVAYGVLQPTLTN